MFATRIAQWNDPGIFGHSLAQLIQNPGFVMVSRERGGWLARWLFSELSPKCQSFQGAWSFANSVELCRNWIHPSPMSHLGSFMYNGLDHRQRPSDGNRRLCMCSFQVAAGCMELKAKSNNIKSQASLKSEILKNWIWMGLCPYLMLKSRLPFFHLPFHFSERGEPESKGKHFSPHVGLPFCTWAFSPHFKERKSGKMWNWLQAQLGSRFGHQLYVGMYICTRARSWPRSPGFRNWAHESKHPSRSKPSCCCCCCCKAVVVGVPLTRGREEIEFQFFTLAN